MIIFGYHQLRLL